MKKLKRRSRRWSDSSTTIADLPEEILIDIFTRLSIKTIVTSRCVLKTWNKILSPSNTHFTQSHFKRSHVQFILETCNSSKSLFHFVELEDDTNLDSIKVFPSRFRLSICDWVAVNSCNGFLLLASKKNHLNPVKICNPITGEYLNLPISKMNGFISTTFDFGIGFPVDLGTIVSGFGCSAKTNQYKVVRWLFRNESEIRMVEVYTIGTKSWRSIEIAPHDHSPLIQSGTPAYQTTFSNGAIHWIFHIMFPYDLIYSFDLESETFSVVPPPHYHRAFFNTVLSTMYTMRKKDTIRIGVLGDFLYLSHNLHLWVMKEYGVQESWTEVCVFDGFEVGTCQAVKYLNDGKMIVNYEDEKLISYDPVRNISKEFKIPQFCSRLKTIAHVPSFVSFNDAMTGDKGAPLRTRMCRVRVEERD